MQIQHGIYSVIVTHKRSNPQHIAISQNAQKCFPVNGKKIATCPDTTEKKEQITDIDLWRHDIDCRGVSCSFVVALTPTDHLYRANSIYICYLFFFLRGIRACCDFLTVYRKAFLSILAYGYVLWIASFMRYYYTIYSVLDLHTYANSFYFADISDIVTYIDENLGDKEIYADCVDVEEPLIGASVIIKGTNTGMITDIEGNFALDAKQGDIIVISYIGMKSAEVKVPANGQIRVMLKEDSQLMDEVVVTGYGDFKKATYTGSASVLNTDKLESLPVVSVAQMMEANIPGLSSVASSSQPGSKATVRVRGIASMNASTEPLYVLDGVPVASRDMSGLSANASAGGLGLIETLNPADIESITVLKDAASASLYGAKGSNGVILITTKKGKEGKMRVSMQATYGITDIAYNYRPIMGGEERRELIYEGFVNYRLNQGDSEAEAKAYADGQIDNYAARPVNGYADWEDALLKKGHQQDYSLSVSGGNEKSAIRN